MGLLNRLSPRSEARASKIAGQHPRDPVLAEIFGSTGRTSAGVNVTPWNAREIPEVDACVSLIEDTVATIPLDLFERTGDSTRERRPENRLHRLLHEKPNEWQTSAEFRQMMEGWRSTHGNAFARIVSSNSGPIALEPMQPGETRPFRFGDGVAFRWQPPDAPARTLMQGEVLHLRDRPARRWNMLEGESKVERHRETIGRAKATGEYLSRFFSNGAVPKTFLLPTAGELLGEEAIKTLRAQFEDRHGGPENAHRIGVLPGGLDIKALGVDNEKAQVVEAYTLLVTQVARIWGIPLHLIGEMTKSTSWGTGIEQQSIGFVVYYMRPKFVMWEQALNAALMSSEMRQRFFFEFNIDGLLRGDFKTRMEGFAIMIKWGLASPNEIRRLMNLPPVDGGDERLQPLNMVPASRVMEVLLRDSNSAAASDTDTVDRMTRALTNLINENRLRLAA